MAVVSSRLATICVTIGEILRAFTPTDYFRRYAQS